MNNIIELEEIDSTNNYIRNNIKELPDYVIVTAKKQNGGKGRRGHIWIDDKGMLPFSILITEPAYPETVPLCAGLAVSKTIEEKCGEKAWIKWPNDIVMRGKKICGILCESVCADEKTEIICGIGINLAQSFEFFKSAGLPYAASIEILTGKAPKRTELMESVREKLAEFSKKSFGELYDEYKSRCVTIGKSIRIIRNGEEKTAFAKDIAYGGVLICEDENGEFEVNSGEVSVRGLMDYT